MIKKFILSLFALACLVHGLICLWRFYHIVAPQSPQVITESGMIAGMPINSKNRARFLFKTDSQVYLVAWYGHHPYLKPGQIWQLTLKILPIPHYTITGSFNYQAYLNEQGISAKAYVITTVHQHYIAYKKWLFCLDRMRFFIRNKLMRVTQGLRYQSVIIALVLGDKSLLSHEDWQVLVKTGTSYFIVISGLHIILMAGVFSFLFRYLWSCFYPLALIYPAQKAGLALGILAAGIYSFAAGFTVPTQRAFISLLVYSIAKMADRKVTSFQNCILALFFVLLWDPLSIFEAGFWLSFFAVAFLIYGFMGAMHKPSLWQHLVYPQWVIFWGILPFCAFYFYEVSWVSLFTNIIALPMMLFMIIPLAIFAAILLLIWPHFALVLFQLADKIIHILWGILAVFVHFHPQLTLVKPAWFIIVLAVLGAFLILAPKGTYRWPALMLIMPLCLGVQLPWQQPESEVLKINISAGRAVLIKSQKQVYIEEFANNNRQDGAFIEYGLMAYLRSQGMRHVNEWILHRDKPLLNIDKMGEREGLKIDHITFEQK